MHAFFLYLVVRYSSWWRWWFPFKSRYHLSIFLASLFSLNHLNPVPLNRCLLNIVINVLVILYFVVTNSMLGSYSIRGERPHFWWLRRWNRVFPIVYKPTSERLQEISVDGQLTTPVETCMWRILQIWWSTIKLSL